MNLNDLLTGLVKNEVGKHRFYSEIGQIVSVDEDNMLCEVSFLSSNANKDVRLGSVISEDATAKTNSSFIIVPKVNTFVMVTFINDVTGFISLFSEVDKVLYQIGDRYIQIDENFIEMDGNTDNMVRYSILKAEYDKTKDVIDSIISILTGTPINEPGNGAPSALQAALSGALAGKATGDISGSKIDEIKTS